MAMPTRSPAPATGLLPAAGLRADGRALRGLNRVADRMADPAAARRRRRRRDRPPPAPAPAAVTRRRRRPGAHDPDLGAPRARATHDPDHGAPHARRAR